MTLRATCLLNPGAFPLTHNITHNSTSEVQLYFFQDSNSLAGGSMVLNLPWPGNIYNIDGYHREVWEHQGGVLLLVCASGSLLVANRIK
jgi:hypothetical protein